MAAPVYFGSHSVSFEEPDIVVFTLRGDVDEDEAKAIVQERLRLSAHLPWVIVICDVTEIGNVSAGARAAFAREGKDGAPRGMLIVGAKWYTRVMMEFGIRAMNLMEGGRNRFAVAPGASTSRESSVEELRRHFRRLANTR